MNKLISTAKKLDTFFKVMQIILTIIMITLIVCSVIGTAGIIFDLPPDMVGTGFDTMELSFFEIKIAQGYTPDFHSILMIFIVAMIFGIGSIVIFKFGVKYIRDILKPMSEGQPFNSIVSLNMKKLSILTMIYGILDNCIGILERLACSYGYNIEKLLENEKVIDVNIDYSFDLSFLIVTALFFLLSYVFKYGEELQQLSDETL